MMEKISVVENGKKIRITRLELLDRALFNSSVKGSAADRRLLLDWLEKRKVFEKVKGPSVIMIQDPRVKDIYEGLMRWLLTRNS